MPRIEFEAETEDELLALAWRWVMGPQRQAGVAASGQAADQADLRRRQLGEVLNAIRGADSKSSGGGESWRVWCKISIGANNSLSKRRVPLI